MKRSKLTVICLLLLAFCMSVLVGCVEPHTTHVDGNNDNKCDECGQEMSDESEDLEYASGTELNMAVVHNNAATSISFKDGSKIGEGQKLADEKIYYLNDLKPVWAALEEELDVKFNDVYSGESSADNEFKAWRTKNFVGVDVAVGNASSITVDGRAGKIVDLADYLDYMPNFKKFLDDNPIVYLSIISDTKDSSIYYAPYFDGFNDIEKYFLMRIDWIEKLLDGPTAFTATISDKFGDICKTVKYQPYMPTTGTVVVPTLSADGTTVENVTKNYDTSYGNIVKYMNDHVNANTTGVELVNMLRGYIDAAYNGKYGNNRSQLFSGYNACWDADELVALLRCVVLNTQALTGQNAEKVTGLFPRENSLNRTSDLLSIASMFGARGFESRNDYLYFDANGTLCDARADESAAEAINKLNQLYSEGLILQNFDTYNGAINKDMYQKNKGFMLYDYVQTQALYNNDSTTTTACPEFNLTAVINPVAKWYDGSNVVENVDQGTYMRFTESWRSVKTNGWCIPKTCTGDKLNAALALFDYAYSEEGAILMSYGPEAWRSGEETITYKGQEIPKLSDKAIGELWSIGEGNYTNYARMFLGSTLPIGFVKDQGMEYQCTTENGKIGAEKVSVAIAQGVLKHVTPEVNENLFYTMVPTVLPTTAAEDRLLAEYAAIQDGGIYSKAKGKYNIYIDVIKSGFGSNAALGSTIITTMPESAKALTTYFNSKDTGGATYLYVQSNAWEKILAFFQENILK